MNDSSPDHHHLLTCPTCKGHFFTDGERWSGVGATPCVCIDKAERMARGVNELDAAIGMEELRLLKLAVQAEWMEAHRSGDLLPFGIAVAEFPPASLGIGSTWPEDEQ